MRQQSLKARGLDDSSSSGAGGTDFQLAPPPADIVQPVSIASSLSAAGYRTPARRTGRTSALADEDQANTQFRLSTPPPDQEPSVSIAQSYQPGRRAPRAFAVVEIASAIVGAVMTRILDNEGDIHWELDQLNGAAHPDGASTSPSTAAYQSKRVVVDGIFVENGFTDRISADFEITFQYNGASIGYIQVSNTGTNDALGWGLTVKENIMADPNTYTAPSSTNRFAAIKVRFAYNFDRSFRSDVIGIRELTLYGNGDVRDEFRWTQN